MKALVTGAATRLGRAMALALAARGYDVAVHYATSRAEAEEVAGLIRDMGRKAAVLQADLLVEDEAQNLVARAAEGLGGPLTVLVNPVITPLGEDTNMGFEACLSVPGMAGPVRRFNEVHVTYQTLKGEEIAFDAEDFHARVIQHECDHLDGILYPSRIEDMSQFGFVEELSRNQGEANEDVTDEADDD